MLGPLSMAKPAPSAKILPPLIHKRFVCRWTSGRFASMMSTRLTSLGRPLNRFSRCWPTTMRPMIATNHVAYLVMGQRSCMASSTVELDVYAAAVATQQATTQQITHAHQQHLERLRYEAALAQRQFNRVDPDNRLVAAELEKRWEGALAELKHAEEAEATRNVSAPSLLALSSELQTAF